MKSIFRVIFCALIVDFFFFSSVFSFTAGYNSKLILGVLGIAVFVISGISGRSLSVSRQLIILTLLASCVSLASLISMNYNHTGDDVYLSYVISMLVWLSAAYMMIRSINFAYGKVTIEIAADYIIAVSVIQCAIALLGNIYEPVNNFIKVLFPGTGWLDSVNRMYGIGDMTALDSGGIRYSIACILCAYMLVRTGEDRTFGVPWYLFAFVFITIVGNMIARTTTVGAILGLVYLLISIFTRATAIVTKIRISGWMILVFTAMIIVSIWLYNTNDIIHKNLRFGFEGFFSMVETGHWRVNSNDKLLTMYVLPDNQKTWIIGDGYFNNPDRDPNYIGDITEGYYKNTDVGYLRFIYYFGIIGLIFFSIMILYAAYMCSKRNPGNLALFAVLLLLNFIVWFKVATDCFFILAVFIALAYVRESSGQIESAELSQ